MDHAVCLGKIEYSLYELFKKIIHFDGVIFFKGYAEEVKICAFNFLVIQTQVRTKLC